MTAAPEPTEAGKAFDIQATGQGRYLLQGDLTFLTAAEALNKTGRLFKGGEALRFDLHGIERTDSAGVALLIEWVRRAGRSGGIRFANLPEPLRAIARVSGVEHFLPVDP